MKIGIIDVGSNSVRLAMLADGKTLYKRLETTRLGGGLSFTGKLSAEAVERTALAISGFNSFAKAEGAEKVLVFATAAVRSASNRRDFLDRVKELCGIEVDIISGEEEAKCGLLGALKGSDGGIIDVGGASTEVTVQCAGKVLYSKSVNIGTVRLNDLAGRDKDRLVKVIEEKLADYGKFKIPRRICHSERSEESHGQLPMYSIGGTATTIASVKHGLKIYDPAITDGTVITLEEILQMADRILSLSVEEVREISGMEPRRADVIGGGCLLMGEVMKHFGIDKITVSESDNLEGYYMLKEGKS